MKAKDILKAVVYSNNIENQGIVEIPRWGEVEVFDIGEWLKNYFGDFDNELSLWGGMEFGKPYFYSYNEGLCYPHEKRYPNWENELHLKNGDVVYLYEVEG